MMQHSNRNIHSSPNSTLSGQVKLENSLDPIHEESKHEIMKEFIREFRFKVASTQEEVEKALSLRHEVFIEELGYEMREIDNKRLESDEYDNSSTHCILIHKKTGKTAGCFRIATTKTPDCDGFQKLPVEEHGDKGISHPSLHPTMFAQETICEASRLAISKNFRLKTGNTVYQNSESKLGVEPGNPENAYPLILVSLFLAAYSLAELLGNKHLYAMMSPTLPRLLRKSGFDFIRLGDTIEFHGKRNVYYINRSLAGSGMQHELHPLHHYIYQELSAQMAEFSETENIRCFTS